MANSNYILITVSGPDRPGITAALMKTIVNSGLRIADMGQSVTHNLLSLSILLKVEEKANDHDYPVLKDLLFVAKKKGVQLDFQLIEEEDTFFNNDLDKFILSCVSATYIPPEFIQNIATILSDHNINILRIDNVSGSQFKSLEIQTISQHRPDMNSIKAELMKVSYNHQVDVAFLRDDIYRRNKRLIVFDMDSTLIQTEVIDEMATVHGVGEQVKKITEAAMNGEINFDESLTQRVALLKGLEANKLHEILEKLPLTSGAPEFIKTVKDLGYKVGIISGGFSFFADALKQKLNLDYAFSNNLEISDGKLTGKIKGPIVNAYQKALLLDLVAQQENIPMEQVVAVGDGANDLEMLAKAGLGIAFHAKDIVRKKAEQHMSYGPMTSILYFLGIPSKDHRK